MRNEAMTRITEQLSHIATFGAILLLMVAIGMAIGAIAILFLRSKND